MYVSPYSQRIVAGTATTLSWQQIDDTGEPADPGTATVTLTRADGTVLATAAATSGTGTAARTYAITQAVSATLDRLTAAWQVGGVTVATTEVDVTAAPWFSNAELRAAEPGLVDSIKYDAAKITAARLQVEAFFERITHRRFVLGYDFRTLAGNPSRDLVLPAVEVRTVRSAALFDDPSATAVETLTAVECAAIPPAPGGVITRYTNHWYARWVKIGFEHGFIAPPADVKRQAMRLCRELLMATKSQLPDNATSWQSSEMGWSAVLVTPGVRGAHTSIPAVNECLDAWTFEEVGIA